MPHERPFLAEANAAGTQPGGTVPEALFDLAVNRAAAALRGAGGVGRAAALAAWHARTRFARRVPLADIQRALAQKPAGECHWQGGPDGGWQAGKAAFP